MNLPTEEQIEQWRVYYRLPENIRSHIQFVKEVTLYLARELNKIGEDYNLELLSIAADLHDIAKPLDMGKLPFKKLNELGLPILSDEDYVFWEEEKKKFKGVHHEEIAAEILGDYPELVEIVGNHSPPRILEEGLSKEAILLNYVDKRVGTDNLMTLDERFSYLAKRYPGHDMEETGRIIARYKEIETDIFNKLGFPAEQLAEMMKNEQ